MYPNIGDVSISLVFFLESSVSLTRSRDSLILLRDLHKRSTPSAACSGFLYPPCFQSTSHLRRVIVAEREPRLLQRPMLGESYTFYAPIVQYARKFNFETSSLIINVVAIETGKLSRKNGEKFRVRMSTLSSPHHNSWSAPLPSKLNVAGVIQMDSVLPI